QAGRLLALWSAIVFAVIKAFDVEAADFAAAGYKPHPIAFHQRRAEDALQRPIMNAAGGKLLARVLPEKFPIGLVEANQHAQIDVAWITLEVAITVVGAQPDLARSDDRVAIGLAAERADPLDVL